MSDSEKAIEQLVKALGQEQPHYRDWLAREWWRLSDAERQERASKYPDAVVAYFEKYRDCEGCKRGEAFVGPDAHEHFRRAAGDATCSCGKEYRQHPHSEHRDWQGSPWLHRLCNGDLVKL